MTFSVANRMMIVNVTVNCWEGRRLDKAITRKTIEDNGVQDDDGLRVNKLLVSKESMKGYMAATSKLRNFVRERTVPWKENGDRGLLRPMYPAFVEGFNALEVEWDNEVTNFIENFYPSEVAKASFRLAEAFKVDDYPHKNDLYSRFKCTLDMDAVAESTDFRVQLDEDTVAEIQGKMKEATEARVNAVMVDVWGRVATMVEHFVNRTAPDIERFHPTTVTNLVELVDMLPGLNLTGDPNLKAIAKRLRADLLGYEPKELKKDLDVRAAARKQAADILEDMKGFMSAFGA